MKKQGFTLAEVLITLGIIGVVAAITLPSLIHNYRAIVLHAQFKEQYSRLAQALRRMVSEEEISLDPGSLGIGKLSSYLAKYYNIASDCGNINSGTGCIQQNDTGGIDTYETYSGKTKMDRQYIDDATLVLNDGTTLFFEQGTQSLKMGHYLITIDINGYKNKPNRLGHDLFTFIVQENGELTTDFSDIGYSALDLCDKTSSSTKNGYGCAKYAIKDADYFKKLPK